MIVNLQSKLSNAKVGQNNYLYTGGKTWASEGDSRPCLVFIHGAQHDHSVWALQSRYFANHGYRVIALDLPGHGRSDGPALASIQAMAAWLNELLIHLKVEQAILIGHSMGSLIAVELAALKGEADFKKVAILAIALLGTALPMRVSDALIDLTLTSEPKAIEQINAWSHSTIAARPGNPGPGFSIYMQNLRLMQRQIAGTLAIDFAACNHYADATQAAAKIAVPCLILQGQLDLMTPVKGAKEAVKLFGKTPDFVLVERAGHALMAERPDAVLAALRMWLGKLD